MKRLTFVLAALSFLFLTAGCGQSGPLYIPGNPSTISAPPPEDVAEEAEENGDTNQE